MFDIGVDKVNEKQHNLDRQIDRQTPYYYLSKYRMELMGLAILWVVWFHSSLYVKVFDIRILNKGLEFIKSTGYGGVDIFLLLSGMGIYNSLNRNSISVFFKNRLKRILPTWWSCLLLYVVLGVSVLGISYSKKSILGFALFTGFWIDMPNQGNWYVYAVMFFYLISPVLFSLIKDSKNKTKTCFIMIFVSLAISFTFFGLFKLIVFSRIPIYILGMYVTANLQKHSMNKKTWICCFAALVIGITVLYVLHMLFSDFLWSYGLWWYPFILIAPSLSLVVAFLFDKGVRRLKPIFYCFKKLGNASLEILLVSDWVFLAYEKLDCFFLSKIITSLSAIILSILFGLLLNFILKFSQRIIVQFWSTGRSRRNNG